VSQLHSQAKGRRTIEKQERIEIVKSRLLIATLVTIGSSSAVGTVSAQVAGFAGT
jgi:hypothetical protein